jgi:hypothetical protein
MPINQARTIKPNSSVQIHWIRFNVWQIVLVLPIQNGVLEAAAIRGGKAFFSYYGNTTQKSERRKKTDDFLGKLKQQICVECSQEPKFISLQNNISDHRAVRLQLLQ